MDSILRIVNKDTGKVYESLKSVDTFIKFTSDLVDELGVETVLESHTAMFRSFDLLPRVARETKRYVKISEAYLNINLSNVSKITYIKSMIDDLGLNYEAYLSPVLNNYDKTKHFVNGGYEDFIPYLKSKGISIEDIKSFVEGMGEDIDNRVNLFNKLLISSLAGSNKRFKSKLVQSYVLSDESRNSFVDQYLFYIKEGRVYNNYKGFNFETLVKALECYSIYGPMDKVLESFVYDIANNKLNKLQEFLILMFIHTKR